MFQVKFWQSKNAVACTGLPQSLSTMPIQNRSLPFCSPTRDCNLNVPSSRTLSTKSTQGFFRVTEQFSYSECKKFCAWVTAPRRTRRTKIESSAHTHSRKSFVSTIIRECSAVQQYGRAHGKWHTQRKNTTTSLRREVDRKQWKSFQYSYNKKTRSISLIFSLQHAIM